MRIITEPKLDFKDVLILPKRSTLFSRSEVNLERTYTFPNSKYTWSGVPIVVANMDTTGTFEMAIEMAKYKCIVCIHKHYTFDDWKQFLDNILLNNNFNIYNHFAVSVGIRDNDIKNLDKIINYDDNIQFICVDVANGYSEFFLQQVKLIRSKYPTKTIIAGNVVTNEMTEELVMNGVDIVKAGIGGGCLAEGTKILMANGTYKNIEDIENGEYVINMNGKPVKVINKFDMGIKDVIKVRTNMNCGILMTPNHKLYIGDLSTSSEKTVSSSGIVKNLDKLTKKKESKYKWKEINDCSNIFSISLLPNKINWKINKNFKIDLAKYVNKGVINKNTIITNGNKHFNRFIESNYDLGYIFGTYLGDGHARISNKNTDYGESGCIHWYFDKKEIHIGEKLIKCLKNVLNVDINYKIKDSILLIELYNTYFCKIFIPFGKKINKHLSEEYYCSNIEYIQGIYDGLIDSDGHIEKYKINDVHCFCNTSKYLIELFQWCCLNLNKSFGICEDKSEPNMNLKGLSKNPVFNKSYNIKTHTTNRFTTNYIYSRILENYNINEKRQVYDIMVDCPTHSFIAENMIVHNSVCTTRIKTGVGYPQLSMVMECADAAHGLKGMVMSDGGCTNSGDIAKAFGAGADFVMLGGMFSGHDESGGNIIEDNGVKYKEFYGMS